MVLYFKIFMCACDQYKLTGMHLGNVFEMWIYLEESTSIFSQRKRFCSQEPTGAQNTTQNADYIS